MQGQSRWGQERGEARKGRVLAAPIEVEYFHSLPFELRITAHEWKDFDMLNW